MTIKEQLLVDIIKLSNQKLLSRLYATFQEIIQQEFTEKSIKNKFINPFDSWTGSFKTKTVEQVLSPSYVYSPVNKKEIVGCWEGNETVEELLTIKEVIVADSFQAVVKQYSSDSLEAVSY